MPSPEVQLRALLVSEPSQDDDLESAIRSAGFDVTTRRHLEAVPPLLDVLDLLVVDLDMPATRDTTPTAETFVQGLRFFRPTMAIVTFRHGTITGGDARLADLDVDWHFQAVPHPAHLTVHARRCANVQRTSTVRATLHIDARQRIARFGDRATRLSPHELAFMALLIERGGDVVARDEAIQALWKSEPPSSDRTIDVLAFRIRQKLADDLGLPDAVRSVRGVGYRLAHHLASPAGDPATAASPDA